MFDKMPTVQTPETGSAWKATTTYAFRAAALFLLVLSIPWDPTYYQALFSGDWTKLQTLFEIGYKGPRAGSAPLFTGWLIAALVALAGAAGWTYIRRHKTDPLDDCYYWTRVAVRYRLAWAFIGSGLVLLLPFQIPAPAISDLHTAYGDFLPWKIYYHSTAVASAGYRQTLGAFELLGAALLLIRRTAGLGAFILAFLLANIVLVNFAYDLGSQEYSLYLLLLAAYLLVYDFPRFYGALVSGSKTLSDQFRPQLTPLPNRWRTTLKGAFLSISLLLTGFAFARYASDSWPYPKTPGLEGATGYYLAEQFHINGRELPPSLTDSTRWRDFVFEEWNTFSIRKNQPHAAPEQRPEIGLQQDAARSYEWLGNGSRYFYRYQQAGDSITGYNPQYPGDSLHLRVERPDTQTIRLTGTNATGDTLSVLLRRVPKKYLLYTGRRKPVSI